MKTITLDADLDKPIYHARKAGPGRMLTKQDLEKMTEGKLLPPRQDNRAEHPFVASMVFQGIPIDIENKKGSFRSGVDKGGHKWRVKMNAHYGEICGSLGTDGDCLDVYVMGNPRAKMVYIVDQMHPDGPDKGKFDEQKCILGADSEQDAVDLYKSQYDKPGFLGKVHSVTLSQFKGMLKVAGQKGKKLAKALEDITMDLVIVHDRPLLKAAEAMQKALSSGLSSLAHNQPPPMGSHLPSAHVPAISPAKPLFTPSELSLPDPKKLRQKTSDPAELYNHAKEHADWHEKIIDRGVGLDKKLGLHTVNLNLEGDNKRLLTHQDFQTAHAKGGMVVTAPLKGQKRLTEKINNKFGGDASRAMDVSRATVAVSHPSDVGPMLHHLRKQGIKYGGAPRDRFSADTEAGYKDMQLTPTAPNGHHGELQVHLLDMLRAKELGLPEHGFHKPGHQSYEYMREFEEGQHPDNPENRRKYDEEKVYSRKLYDKAGELANARKPHFSLEKAMGRRKESASAAVQRHNQPGYYDWDGIPAVRRTLRGPIMIWHKTAKAWRPIPGAERSAFAHEAQRVDGEHLRRLAQRHGANYHV